MPEIKLKPCPFCGGEAVLFADDGVRVMCAECSASTRIERDTITMFDISGNAVKTVIRVWNERVDANDP